MNLRECAPADRVEDASDDFPEVGPGEWTRSLPESEAIDVVLWVAAEESAVKSRSVLAGTHPPSMVINVYNVRPMIKKILVILIQNSASPNHRTDQRLSRPKRTKQTEIKMAGFNGFQYSTMTLMAVSSKQTKAH
jgi:hypothetical protein